MNTLLIENSSLDSINVIKYPIITEKAIRLSEQNKYSFAVDPKANKNIIKKAVENLFQVKVISVNTLNQPTKTRRVGKFIGKKTKNKKAIVKLAPGDSIQLFENQ